MSEIFGRLGGPRDVEAADDTAPELQPNARGGRWLRRHLASAAVALTTVVDGRYRASTLTGVLVASTDPLLILISLEQDTQMETWVRECGAFAVSLLTSHQQFLADRFAGLAPLASARFEGIPHFTSTTGCPLLSEAIAWADCRVSGEFETGDHTCILGQVLDLGAGKGADEAPLIYFQNQYIRAR